MNAIFSASACKIRTNFIKKKYLRKKIIRHEHTFSGKRNKEKAILSEFINRRKDI